MTILATTGAVQFSTAHSLAMARADIHSAVGADDNHRPPAIRPLSPRQRRHRPPRAHQPPREREYAEYYLADAEAMLADDHN